MVDQSILDSEKSFFGKKNENQQPHVKNIVINKNTSVENDYDK